MCERLANYFATPPGTNIRVPRLFLKNYRELTKRKHLSPSTSPPYVTTSVFPVGGGGTTVCTYIPVRAYSGGYATTLLGTKMGIPPHSPYRTYSRADKTAKHFRPTVSPFAHRNLGLQLSTPAAAAVTTRTRPLWGGIPIFFHAEPRSKKSTSALLFAKVI